MAIYTGIVTHCQPAKKQLISMQCPEFGLFVEQSGIAIGNYLQALYLNRARARRRLRKGMEDWERMRVHAVNADYHATFHSYITSEKAGWTLAEGSELGPCQVRVLTGKFASDACTQGCVTAVTRMHTVCSAA